MNNREIYQIDPSTRKLANQGVAAADNFSLDTLQFELDTFVCEGQYKKGLEQILTSFLGNLSQAEQPGVWISGFFGSGKSHMVKILRALWENTRMNDNRRARDIVHLPDEISDLLAELTNEGRRRGGLRVISGTLSSGTQISIRLSLLGLLFKALNLPDNYSATRFVIWLKREHLEEQVETFLYENGYNYEEELRNLFVSEGLSRALASIRPNQFTTTNYSATIQAQFPPKADINSQEMLSTMRDALTLDRDDGKFPLTLIALDEVQQYIGEDSKRSMDVQKLVEDCCKEFGGQVLFVATGQSALSSTSNLKKLEGRFTVRIELSDADVDTVVRQVILAKKATAKPAIEQIYQTYQGEISRHLSESKYAHRSSDSEIFPQDYPILPVRHRFWESALRALDVTGTDSQVRNQLTFIHNAVQENLDKPLGNVIPADYIFYVSADRLLQSSVIPREIHDGIMRLKEGSANDILLSRACAVIFLIGIVNQKNNNTGLHANVNTIADLLLEDLAEGSTNLRSQLPNLLEHCDLLMRIEDEYRIQTQENHKWTTNFKNQKVRLNNDASSIDVLRSEMIQNKFRDYFGRNNKTQGVARVSREVELCFESQLPSDADQKTIIWMRDGWSAQEQDVVNDARQAGSTSPVLFVFVPKLKADILRKRLIEMKAASTVLELNGTPTTVEGNDAKRSMETMRDTAKQEVNEIIEELLSNAQVYQGNGTELTQSTLLSKIDTALQSSFVRLYTQFCLVDKEGWAKVYDKASKGNPDALQFAGFSDSPQNNAVCKQVLEYISPNKKGPDIRKHFMSAPFGWDKDAIDAVIAVLLQAELISATNERNLPAVLKDITHTAISKWTFKVEQVAISTTDRIKIRSLFQKLDISVQKSGEESKYTDTFLNKLSTLVERASGENPKPARPNIELINQVRTLVGNSQLLEIAKNAKELEKKIEDLKKQAQAIEARLPNWNLLLALRTLAEGIDNIEEFRSEIEAISQNRQLLDNPDPVKPLLDSLAGKIRSKYQELQQQWSACLSNTQTRLNEDANWQQLDAQTQNRLLLEHQAATSQVPELRLRTPQEVSDTLTRMTIPNFRDRIDAMPGRISQVLVEATRLCQPQTQIIELPKRTLNSESDIQQWLEEVQNLLAENIHNGPVMIK